MIQISHACPPLTGYLFPLSGPKAASLGLIAQPFVPFVCENRKSIQNHHPWAASHAELRAWVLQIWNGNQENRKCCPIFGQRVPLTNKFLLHTHTWKADVETKWSKFITQDHRIIISIYFLGFVDISNIQKQSIQNIVNGMLDTTLYVTWTSDLRNMPLKCRNTQPYLILNNLITLILC